MTNKEAIEFGKEQLEIFGDSQMSEFIRLAIKAFETGDRYNEGYLSGLACAKWRSRNE
jgi:hypothetical protein